MSTRQLFTTIVLAGLAQVTLIAAGVFLGEPERTGHPAPHLHFVDLAFVAAPVLLIAAAAYAPVRVLLRRRARQA